MRNFQFRKFSDARKRDDRCRLNYQLLKIAKFSAEKIFVVKSRNSNFLYLLSAKFTLHDYTKFLLFNKKRFSHCIGYRLKDEAVRLRRLAMIGNKFCTVL